MLKLKNENLTNIRPIIYNDLFSNKKNYNRKQKINKEKLPKINTNSLSPKINFNEYGNINQNSKRSNDSNNYNHHQITDRQYKHEHSKILTNYHFFYNKKNNYRRNNNINVKNQKLKKNGLNIKNIELEDNKDIKSKSITNYNLYTLKDINIKNIFKKKKNKSKGILNKKIKIENFDKIFANNKVKNYDLLKGINSNINDHHKNMNNYTDRNLNNDNLKINGINDKICHTSQNIDIKKTDSKYTNNNRTHYNEFKYKINNLFLKLLSNNISHKIELNNQSNKKISLEIVKNLLNEEIDMLNKNQILYKEEVKNKLNKLIKINKKNNKSNKGKLNNLSIKEQNFEKLNEKNNIDSNKNENYNKKIRTLSKLNQIDLTSESQMYDENYFLKNNKMNNLDTENREVLLKDKVINKDIDDYVTVNIRKNKSRNSQSNFYSYKTEIEEMIARNRNQEKFPENYNTTKNGFTNKELKEIVNNLIFKLSNDLNENLNEYKNKVNSLNINSVVINGNNCFSMGDLYERLNNVSHFKKRGIHNFHYIRKSNKNKINNSKINYILNNYLITGENIDEKTKGNIYDFYDSEFNQDSNNNYNNQDKNNNNYNNKYNINNNSKSTEKFNSSSFINKVKMNNNVKFKRNGILNEAFPNSDKSIKNLSLNKISSSFINNKQRNSFFKTPNQMSSEYNELNNDKNIKNDRKSLKQTRNDNIISKDKFKKDTNIKEYINNNNNNNKSHSSFSSLGNSDNNIIESQKYENNEKLNTNENKTKKNININVKDNKHIKIQNKGDLDNKDDNKDNGINNDINDGIDDTEINKQNKNFKKNLLENMSRSNLTKTNKKKKKKNKDLININNKMSIKDKNCINEEEKQNNDNITEDNNNSIMKKRSNSIGDTSQLFSFNNKNNIKYNYKKSNKKKEIVIRKEVQDILDNNNISFINNSNNNNNENNNLNDNNIFVDKQENKFKKRFKPSIIEELAKIKKKKFHKIKREKGKGLSDFKKMEIENLEKNEDELNEEKKEKIFEKKMYDFFEKIQHLKNCKIENYEEELKMFIDEEIDKINDFDAKDRESRINSFMRDFQLNRKKFYFFQQFQKRDLVFVSPLKFSSTSKNFKKNK